MCELLGSTPKEEEIPISREDLNPDTQLALFIYDRLQANWEGFSGQYLGKDYSLIPVLLKEFEYDKLLSKYVWEIIPIIDNIVAQDVAKKAQRKTQQHSTPPRS